MRKLAMFTAIAAASLLTACGSSSDDKKKDSGAGQEPDPKELVYKFDTFLPDVTGSSVSYSGQTARHILINDLKTYLGSNPNLTKKDEVVADVLKKFIYRNESAELDYKTRDKSATDLKDNTTFTVKGGKEVLQTAYATDKNLVGKIAGQDKESHLRFDFYGWNDADIVKNAAKKDKPLAALFDMLNQYGEVAALRANGTTSTIPLPNGGTADLDSTFVNAEGLDFQQIINKYLLMSITFSQGTADYLKTDFSKGNDAPAKAGKKYTNAEHKWDEAFGYLGAARNMPAFTDLEARAKSGREAYKYGYFDANGDNKIDINSELNLGQAVNCAKRDIGSLKKNDKGEFLGKPVDYTKEVFEAFYKGRKLLNDAKDNLKPAQVTELQGYAKTAAIAWEKCIAATVVHYINDTIADLDYTDLAGFKKLAKHWGEMKGFGLGLQFSPFSPVTESVYKEVIDAMGMAPVLANGSQNGGPAAQDPAKAIADYKTALKAARTKLADAYGADDAAFKANAEIW